MTDNKKKLFQGKPMGRKLFREVMFQMFNIPNEEIIERMHAAIEIPNSSSIDPEVWANLLSLFCRGTLDEKILFCFSVSINNIEEIRTCFLFFLFSMNDFEIALAFSDYFSAYFYTVPSFQDNHSEILLSKLFNVNLCIN